MFADLDEALRQLLIREVPLGANDVDIVFQRPDRENVARFGKPTIDLFLFDASENHEFPEAGWQKAANGNGVVGLRWPPLRVDVRYFVTVWAQAVEDEHRLLFHVYRTLRRLTEVPEGAWEGALAGHPRTLHLQVEDGAVKELIDLWGVLDNRMQPGLVLKATVAIDLNAVREAPVVRTSTLRARRFGQGPEMRHRLSGRVVDGAGKPVSGARVRARGRGVGVETAEDGGFRIASVPGEATDLTVEAPGYRPRTEPVAVPGTYEITLEPEGGGDAPPPARGRGRKGGGS